MFLFLLIGGDMACPNPKGHDVFAYFTRTEWQIYLHIVVWGLSGILWHLVALGGLLVPSKFPQ